MRFDLVVTFCGRCTFERKKQV